MKSWSSITKQELESKVLNLYKPISKSPGEVIERLKELFPELKDEKVSPTGKLDPLAHGVMAVLIGDENRKRRDYEESDKVYEFDVILGIQTDSYDILGIPEIIKEQEIIITKGKRIQDFPAFSAYKVNGKPLFHYAKAGTLDTIEIPQKEIEIYDIEELKRERRSFQELREAILEQIEALEGTFRQEEIISAWKALELEEVTIVSYRAEVSKGTYIRGLANEMGGTAMNIFRTRAGEFVIDESIYVYST